MPLARVDAGHTMLREAQCFERRRRETSVSPTGAQALARLMKTDAAERYVEATANECPRPKLLAADIDEPEHAHVVEMLAGLPPDESRFYAAETNVIGVAGKSTVQFEALEAQDAFVAGPKEEYLAYFRRKLPERMWVWRKAEDAKAFASFAVAAK